MTGGLWRGGLLHPAHTVLYSVHTYYSVQTVTTCSVHSVHCSPLCLTASLLLLDPSMCTLMHARGLVPSCPVRWKRGSHCVKVVSDRCNYGTRDYSRLWHRAPQQLTVRNSFRCTPWEYGCWDTVPAVEVPFVLTWLNRTLGHLLEQLTSHDRNLRSIYHTTCHNQVGVSLQNPYTHTVLKGRRLFFQKRSGVISTLTMAGSRISTAPQYSLPACIDISGSTLTRSLQADYIVGFADDIYPGDLTKPLHRVWVVIS